MVERIDATKPTPKGKSFEGDGMPSGEDAILDVKADIGDERQLIRFYADQLRAGHVGALIKTLLADPSSREKFLSLHKDKKIIFGSDEPLNSAEKISAVVVTLMRDPKLRAMFIDSALHDMNDRSTILRKGIRLAVESFNKGKRDEAVEKSLVYNEVFIGAGVHAAIYDSRFTALNPSAKRITIEASSVISNNFRTKGFVAINSPNRPHGPETPSAMLRRGNLNTFGKRAPVQLPYVESEKYPAAAAIADVATANEYLSNNDLIMDTPVDRVILPHQDSQSDTWPAKYKVLFKNGLFIFADKVRIASGNGDNIFPESFDDETMDVIEEGLNNSDANKPPGVMTYDQLGKFITECQTPFRPFNKKKILVAGGKHSSMTAIEFFVRTGKREVYKQDVMQAGEVTRVDWVGVKASDRTGFYGELDHPRYAQIADEMPDPDTKFDIADSPGKINPLSGYLEQVRKSDRPEEGRYRAILRMRDGTFQEIHTDYIVMTAGYINRINEFFGEETNPFDDPQKAEIVKGFFDDIQSTMPIAVKLKNEDVFALGPAAIGKVLVRGEIEMSGLQYKQNQKLSPGSFSIAISAFGPRTERLAEAEAAKQLRSLKKAERNPSLIEIALNKKQRTQKEYQWTHTQGQPQAPTDITAKVALATVFDRLRLTSDISFPHLVIRVKRGTEGDLRVSFDPVLADESAQKFLDEMINQGVCDNVFGLIGRGRQNSAEFKVNIAADGTINVPTLESRFFQE